LQAIVTATSARICFRPAGRVFNFLSRCEKSGLTPKG
jgi:hypothetical protein